MGLFFPLSVLTEGLHFLLSPTRCPTDIAVENHEKPEAEEEKLWLGNKSRPSPDCTHLPAGYSARVSHSNGLWTEQETCLMSTFYHWVFIFLLPGRLRLGSCISDALPEVIGDKSPPCLLVGRRAHRHEPHSTGLKLFNDLEFSATKRHFYLLQLDVKARRHWCHLFRLIRFHLCQVTLSRSLQL